MEIDFKVENIVASAALKEELDLYKIARDVNNVEYEPEQFPGAILKLKDPKTSLLLFKNGKLICTGAKSKLDVERAITLTYNLVKKCVRNPKATKGETPHIDFEIVNIVASANLELELDLYDIARNLGNVEYEPEQFPGAILKLKDPKTSLLLFKNGKLICTGAKSKLDVERAINKTFNLIKDSVKGPVSRELTPISIPKMTKQVAQKRRAQRAPKAKPKKIATRKPKRAAKKPKRTAVKKRPKKVKKTKKKVKKVKRSKRRVRTVKKKLKRTKKAKKIKKAAKKRRR